MKKIIATLAFGAAVLTLVVTACKEQIPTGLVLAPPFATTDSTYVATLVPAAQMKNVLIEEYTGVRCPNCPAGGAAIAAIRNANAPRVIVAKLHSNFLASPILATDPDLRTTEAEALSVAMNVPSKPTFAVDRLPNAGNASMVWQTNDVQSKLTAQLAKATTVNIDISTLLNTAKDTLQLAATFTCTNAISDTLAYHIYLLENDIEATQDSLGVDIEGYVHEEVLRHCITPVFVGEQLPTGLKEKGRVYRRTYRLALPSKVNKVGNCVAVVFITNKNSNEVLQVVEKHL